MKEHAIQNETVARHRHSAVAGETTCVRSSVPESASSTPARSWSSLAAENERERLRPTADIQRGSGDSGPLRVRGISALPAAATAPARSLLLIGAARSSSSCDVGGARRGSTSSVDALPFARPSAPLARGAAGVGAADAGAVASPSMAGRAGRERPRGAWRRVLGTSRLRLLADVRQRAAARRPNPRPSWRRIPTTPCIRTPPDGAARPTVSDCTSRRRRRR